MLNYSVSGLFNLANGIQMNNLSNLLILKDSSDITDQLVIADLTPQESAQQWLVLQRAFEGQLKETEAIFAEDRRKSLIELQRRLNRLAEWQATNG